ncbi:MAG: hypothetical protein IJH34_17860 [Romboutsia sp.]|nr:hypothetical protein [Romboutsia sp.]
MKFEYDGKKIDTGDRKYMIFSNRFIDIEFSEFSNEKYLTFDVINKQVNFYPF